MILPLNFVITVISVISVVKDRQLSGTDRTNDVYQTGWRKEVRFGQTPSPSHRGDHSNASAERGGYRITSSRKSLRPSLELTQALSHAFALSGLPAYVASSRLGSIHSFFETPSLPALRRCYPRSFAFYVGRPASSIPGIPDSNVENSVTILRLIRSFRSKDPSLWQFRIVLNP